MKQQRWEEAEKSKQEERRSDRRKQEERRSRCAKRYETFCFSNVLWLRWVEK
jgi:hypothetical protein